MSKRDGINIEENDFSDCMKLETPTQDSSPGDAPAPDEAGTTPDGTPTSEPAPSEDITEAGNPAIMTDIQVEEDVTVLGNPAIEKTEPLEIDEEIEDITVIPSGRTAEPQPPVHAGEPAVPVPPAPPEMQFDDQGREINPSDTPLQEKVADDGYYTPGNIGIGASYYEPDQDARINEAQSSEKGGLRTAGGIFTDNIAPFLKRHMIVLILCGLLMITILALAFLPGLHPVKEKVNSELDKAQQIFIPSEIEGMISDTGSGKKTAVEASNEEPAETVTEDANSSTAGEATRGQQTVPLQEENHQDHRAPVNYGGNANGGNTVSFPITNRNEQQKALSHVPLDNDYKLRNPVSTQQPGIPGTFDGNGKYTPASLQSNMEKYLPQLLGNAGSQKSGGYSASSYVQQNDQDGKNLFYNNHTGGDYKWNGECSLWKGTIIPAVLETGINTDLPGAVIASVTTNVYSSLNGKYILIPQGSKLYAEYNSSVSWGQDRVQVIWNTLIRPDGLEINLGGLNGVDAFGKSGYPGFTNYHPFEYLKAMGLIGIFSFIDTKVTNSMDTSNNNYAQNVMSDIYSEQKKLTNKIMDRALDIQPTITIPGGTEINLITNVSMSLPPLEPQEVESFYIRY